MQEFFCIRLMVYLDVALFDAVRSGRTIEISDSAEVWIMNIACQRTTDIGYSQELWILAKLYKHIHSMQNRLDFRGLQPSLKYMYKNFFRIIRLNQLKSSIIVKRENLVSN